MRRVLSTLLLLLAGCAIGSREPAPERAGPEDATPRVRAFVAATEDGIALVDADTGAVISRARAGRVEDVVVDARRRRVVTFATTGDDEGEVAALALDAFALAPARRLEFVDGRARLAVLARGLVVFEDAYGPRWRLLDEDARAAVALPLPMPSAAWTTRGGARLEAFARAGDGAFVLLGVDGVEGGLEIVEAVRTEAVTSAFARAVAIDAGPVVLDLDDATLVVRPRDRPPRRIDVVHAGALADARSIDADRVAVLTAEPAQLIVLAFDGARDVSACDVLALDGHARADPQLLSRGLVVLDSHRLLVATSDGARAVRIGGPDGARLRVDPTFAARGIHAPIDGPMP